MSERTYPRWIYNRALGAEVVVESAEHEAALGEGWSDSPADPPAEPEPEGV